MDKISKQAFEPDAYIEPRTQRLWLVRHGVTHWNIEQRFCGQSDIPLATQGRMQARWLARRLQSEHIVAIYSSDLQRARETAEIIRQRQQHAVSINEAPLWREINFGAWEGLTYAQIVQRFGQQPGFFCDPEHCAAPGGESLADVVRRVSGGLRQISAYAASWGDIVIVSHGGTLRALLCQTLGMPLEHQWRLRLDPGSLSAIDLLPMCDAALPQAILISLNVQRPEHSSRSAAPLSHSGSRSHSSTKGTTGNVSRSR